MAGAIHFVTSHVRWGEHRGGMFVEVEGQDKDGGQIVHEPQLLGQLIERRRDVPFEFARRRHILHSAS